MILDLQSSGLLHSEICGSKLACNSPQLIAAYHVLLRLLMPRHSPCALISLTTFCLVLQNYALHLRSYFWNCIHNIYCRWIFSMFSSFALLLNFFIQFSRYFALKNFHSSWWAQVDSNHRPHAYQACALTTWAMRPFAKAFRLIVQSLSLTFGGDEEDRTPDPLRARQVLSQLSYTPIW